jgi:hypothetical protein
MSMIVTYGPYKTVHRDAADPQPVKASAVIPYGCFVDLDSSGYLQPCGSGDIPFGVSLQEKTGGTADGDVECLVDSSPMSLYRVKVGTGTITQAMVGKTCDIDSSTTIDVTASTDDCIEIVRALVAENEAIIRIVRPLLGGVV